MALFENMSMDDYNKLQARYQQKQAQNTAQNLANRQAALNAAQKKSQGGLVDTLVGLATGIKDKVVDAGATLNNIGKTVAGGIDEIFANKANKDTMADDSKRRNDIAKKYGYNSYSDALNDDNASQDFWNEIKESNKTTQNKLKETRKTYDKSYGNVQDVNLNKAAGQALNTIDTVGMALGGGAGVAANILGGGLASIGDQYKADAEAGKKDLNWSNFNLKNAATGLAGGAAGSLAGGALGKAASKAGNPLTKALTSQLGQGIGSGAAAGAAGGLAGTLANGGSIEDALANALQGAKGGALGGGVMAGTMGLAGKGLNKLQNGKTTAVNAEPVDAQVVAKNKIAQPQTKAIEAEIVEPVNNRRGIAIKDYNAGVENIPVRVVEGVEPVQGRGKYIDGVVAGKNLPEAKVPTQSERYANYFGDTLLNQVANGDMGDANGIIKTLRDAGVTTADINALKNGAQTVAADSNIFGAYGMNSRQDLPLLDRQEYYFDRTGKPGASITSEDIPAYMQDRMRNGAGNGRSDNESIMREVFGNNMDKEQMYDLYEQLAQTTQQPTYTPENLGFALASDDRLAGSIEKALLDQYNPTQRIAVQGGPAISDTIPVTDRTTRYTESTLPARTYEAPTARAEKVMNAEPTAVKPTPTTTAVAEPELDYVTEVQRQKAQIAANKAKSEAVGGVVGQYGTTRLNDRIEGLPEAIEDMLKLGLTDRAEIDLYSSKMTGADSPIAKAIRKSLNDAEPIDGNWGFTWDDVFNAAGAAADKNAQGKITKFYEGQAAKYLKADENGLFNRNDVYDFGKALEKEGYKMRDRGERTQNNLNQVYGDALVNMSKDIIGKATDGVNPKGYLNLNELVKILPNNEEHAARMAELVNNGNTVQDLRSAMSNSTKMNRFKEAEEYNMNTYGQNQGDKGIKSAGTKVVKDLATGHPVKAIGDAAAVVAEKVTGSDKAKQKAIKKSYENYKKYQAQANGEAPTTPTGKLSGVKQTIADKTGKVGETAKNIAGKAAEKIGNATADLNNTTAANIAIGGTTLGDIAQKMANRTIAQNQAEYAQNRAETAKAQQAVEDATNQYNTAQTLANNAMAATQQSTGTGATLDRIARAMDLAMQAGDMNAYGQLADLYKQAYSIYELQNPSKAKDAKALSANQSKALAASQQLEQLAQMTPDAGTVASNIPLVSSLVDLAGGNQYANQAEALATTLGYLLSGANIKESEAKRIGQSYVPTAFDSEAVRQQKLDRARQLIQSYMSDTGAIEA